MLLYIVIIIGVQCARDNETNEFPTWGGSVIGGAASCIKGIFESQYLRIRKPTTIEKTRNKEEIQIVNVNEIFELQDMSI